MVSGEEAVRLGLATRVADDPRAEALALAREIAGKNPAAIRGIKILLDLAGTRPLAESFLDESRRMGELIGSPNQVEAIMAELEGRPADFTDE
jgi:enoyl-CoA hydratase/carnithine racemase